MVVQPLASFTVMVWFPAATLLKTFDDWYVPLLRRYCNTPVPPDAVTVMVEVKPRQTVGAEADAIIAGGAGSMVIGVVARQPFESRTVTV